MAEISKTQIDRLGERLKESIISDDDLRLLDNYRRSFAEGYEITVDKIRKKLGLNPTGRPAKSTASIIDKLRRESIRLTQMQDIAGCRIVVPDITRQDHVVTIIKDYFDNVRVVDRRENPSYGYRAVHLIIKCSGKIIEVQVRTSLQHLWAEISEKISDKDPMVKYGGGNKKIVAFLDRLSKLFYNTDLNEYKAAALTLENNLPQELRRGFEEYHAKAISLKEQAVELCTEIRVELEKDTGGLNDFLDSI